MDTHDMIYLHTRPLGPWCITHRAYCWGTSYVLPPQKHRYGGWLARMRDPEGLPTYSPGRIAYAYLPGRRA